MRAGFGGLNNSLVVFFVLLQWKEKDLYILIEFGWLHLGFRRKKPCNKSQFLREWKAFKDHKNYLAISLKFYRIRPMDLCKSHFITFFLFHHAFFNTQTFTTFTTNIHPQKPHYLLGMSPIHHFQKAESPFYLPNWSWRYEITKPTQLDVEQTTLKGQFFLTSSQHFMCVLMHKITS